MKLRCVCTAPFGRPVVPDVYMIAASASASTTNAGSGGSSPVDDVVHGDAAGYRRGQCGRDGGPHLGLAEVRRDALGALVVGEQHDACPESASPYASSGRSTTR